MIFILGTMLLGKLGGPANLIFLLLNLNALRIPNVTMGAHATRPSNYALAKSCALWMTIVPILARAIFAWRLSARPPPPPPTTTPTPTTTTKPAIPVTTLLASPPSLRFDLEIDY